MGSAVPEEPGERPIGRCSAAWTRPIAPDPASKPAAEAALARVLQMLTEFVCTANRSVSLDFRSKVPT